MSLPDGLITDAEIAYCSLPNDSGQCRVDSAAVFVASAAELGHFTYKGSSHI